jgi:hypothetical protein
MATPKDYTQILYYGTQADYEKSATVKDNYKLFFCTDTGKLYKGTVDFTDSIVVAAERPATPIIGKIYLISGTQTVETYRNNAWQVLAYRDVLKSGLDEERPVSTIDSSSTDNQLASAKNVYLAIQEAIGGGTVVTNVTASDSTDNTIIVTKGDGSTATVQPKGVAHSPSWNETNRVLTIPVQGASDLVVNIGKDLVLESGRYDSATHEIVLVLNDAEQTEIRVNVGDLIDEYVGSTDADGIDINISTAASGASTISATLHISETANNGLTVESDGLFVDTSDFATKAEATAALNAATAAQSTANAATAAIEIINGDSTTAGSTDKKIADAVANYVSTATFNTTTAALSGDIEQNTVDIAALAAAATGSSAWGTF